MEPKTYEFGPYRLDTAARCLYRGEQLVPLPPKVLEILALLVQRHGEVIDKEVFFQTVWSGTFVEESNLTQGIFVLRKTLEGAAYIETVPKRGYRFAAPVREVAPAPPPVWARRWMVPAAAVALLAAAASVYVLRGRALPERQSLTIAVLPFQNLSGDPGQDYLADGLTENLTGELGRIRSLRVRSRTSAARFRKSAKPMLEIGRELNVDTVVEGSVVLGGNRVHVVCQLIDVASDTHLWSQTFDRPIHDVPTLLREVAEQISLQVRLRVSEDDRRRFAVRRTVNGAAVESYFRGRYALEQRTPESVAAAIAHFEKAIQADPSYALPHAGLADSYNQLGTVVVGVRSPAETRPLAKAAARRALEIDPQLAEAHAALGYSSLYDFEWANAERALKRAIELNPSYGYAHQWWSHYLTQQGRFDEAIQEIYAARELDPLSPVMRTQVVFMLQFARRYEESVAEAGLVTSSEPGYVGGFWTLGIARVSQGRAELAIPPLETAVRQSGRNPSMLGTLGQAYGLAGRTADAQAILRELQTLTKTRYVSPLQLAVVNLSLRQDDEFFRWFTQAFEERSNGMAWLRVWSVYDRLRNDPRFKAIDAKVFRNQ